MAKKKGSVGDTISTSTSTDNSEIQLNEIKSISPTSINLTTDGPYTGTGETMVEEEGNLDDNQSVIIGSGESMIDEGDVDDEGNSDTTGGAGDPVIDEGDEDNPDNPGSTPSDPDPKPEPEPEPTVVNTIDEEIKVNFDFELTVWQSITASKSTGGVFSPNEFCMKRIKMPDEWVKNYGDIYEDDYAKKD